MKHGPQLDMNIKALGCLPVEVGHGMAQTAQARAQGHESWGERLLEYALPLVPPPAPILAHLQAAQS